MKKPSFKIAISFVAFLSTFSSLQTFATSSAMDPSFDVGAPAGFNADVNSLAIQSDGRIILGGDFTTYKGVQTNHIVRLNADDTKDTSFNIGSGFEDAGDQTVSKIILQGDGKIIVWGAFTKYNGTQAKYLARLNSDGSLDTSFESGLSNQWNISNITIQSDGKILIGGGQFTYNGVSKQGIIRLNSDGSIDNSFDAGDAFSYISSIGIQSDGKLIISEYTPSNYGGGFALIRINADGSIDNSFKPGYIGGGVISSIAIQADGKIIALGQISSYQDPSYVLGYCSNGVTEIDQVSCENMGSCSDGRQRIDQGSCEAYSCSDPQYTDQTACEAPVCSDPQHTDQTACEENGNSWQQINYRGQQNWWNNDYNTWTQGIKANGIIRLNTDGSMDTGFVTGEGFSSIDGSWTVAIQDDGKIVVGGSFYTYNNMSSASFARLNNDGTLDTSLNIGLNFGSQVNGIGIKSNGEIVIGGSLYYNGEAQRFSHINVNGTRESIFNIGDGFNGRVLGIEIQNNGKILVGGSFSSYRGAKTQNIVRLNTDGSRDTSFAIGNGISGYRPYVQILKTQSDGKVILAGNFTGYQGVSANNILRVNTDGSRDNSFDIGSGFNNAVGGVAIQSDGKMIVEGWFNKYQGNNVACMIRLNADGSKDSSFTIDPSLSLDCPSLTSINVLNDGKILLAGGRGGGYWKILRLNADGSKDTSFNSVDGRAVSSQALGVHIETIYSLAIQNDGKIIIGGIFSNPNTGGPTENIIRLNTNGTKDNTFDSIGLNMKSLGWGNVDAVQLQNDGKILVGWSSANQQGLPIYKLSRLNTDGSKDTSFDEGILDNSIATLAQNSVGKVFFGGNFTSYNGSAAGYIMSLYGDTEMVSLPNSNDSGVVTSAFTSKGYTENNGILNGSTPISLTETDGGILTDLGLSNKGINITIPANTQFKKAGALTNYDGIISVPMIKAISTVNNQSVISAFKVGSTSQSIVLEGGIATLLLPTPGEDVGNIVNVYYSEDNAGSWYFQTQSTVIDHNGEPYIQFTTDHFTDFAITKVDSKSPIGTITYDPTSPSSGNVTATLTLNGDGVIINNSGNNTHTFTNNGSFTFTFQDLAGNTTSAVATVDWIDKTAPTASVIYNITGTTDQNVIATLTGFSESITGWNVLNYIFTENGSFVFTFRDLVGNFGNITATVDQINKTAVNTTGSSSNTGSSNNNGGSSSSSSRSSSHNIISPLIDEVGSLLHGAADNEAGSIKDSRYPTESNNAYLWAYKMGITTQTSIQQANLDGKLYRSHLAKMISEYAVKQLKKTANTGVKCEFTDMNNQSKEMRIYAQAACQLGLMGLKSDGTPDTQFNPNAEITRAQFATTLSRLLRGDKNNTGSVYYEGHLQALKKVGIMTKINKPTMKELRGNVFVMLQRAATAK